MRVVLTGYQTRMLPAALVVWRGSPGGREDTTAETVERYVASVSALW